ncbi:MAG TPA: YceI family protein [Clostridia bacterium]|nr:YceI family protein [Clostridia bacterium]
MTTFQIDPAHTEVGFSARHMMVTKVRGKFTDVRGSIDFDEKDPSRSSAEIVIGAASIDTGVGPRDAHLRSADFLDAEQHPELVIRTTSIRPKRGGSYTVTADATVRGVTRPVELDAEILGFYNSMDGARRVGVSARTTINRKDWGLDWNVALETGGWLVSEQVAFEIELALEQVSAAAAA